MTLRTASTRMLAAAFFAALAAGCAGATAGAPTHAWIDVPVDGLRVDLGETVRVEGHVAGPVGTIRVQILVDGATVGTVDAAVDEGAVAGFAYAWTPSATGDFVLGVAPMTADGASGEIDTAHITVVKPSTSTPTATLVPTGTPTPTIPPGAEVEFWVDPPEIAAGGCARLNWRVRGASSVRLGGTDVTAEGHYDACLCRDDTFTLSVTNLDGSEQQRRVTIAVTGTCVTPSPVPDVTGPPAPSLSSPAQGASLSCVGSVNLDWNGASDPSGIAEYRLESERHSGDHNWQDAPGSPWSGIGGTSRSIAVQCGWTYRWRVRAVDGAGNIGPWSSWFTFTVPLT